MGATKEVGNGHPALAGQLDIGQPKVAVAEGNEEGEVSDLASDDLTPAPSPKGEGSLIAV